MKKFIKSTCRCCLMDRTTAKTEKIKNGIKKRKLGKWTIAIYAIIALFTLALVTAPFSIEKFPTQNDVALGDAAPIFLGGTNIRPYGENSITLKKEDLTIQFGSKNTPYTSASSGDTTAYVSAKFVFVNTGKDISLKVGFPFGLATEEDFGTPNISNASVKINGKKITPLFLSAETGKYDPWMYFNVSFYAKETKTLEVAYYAYPTDGYFLYVLKTGALWKGPIGELNIDLKFPYRPVYPAVLSVAPSGCAVKGNDIVYHLKNYEPDKNIKVGFLSEKFYKKIAPLREKAEKTGTPEDWYAYARALLPVDIVGPYGSRYRDGFFIKEYKANGYEKFVQKELTEAVKNCKGTVYEKILQVADAARFNKQDTFSEGVYGMKDFTQIEHTFGTSLEKPETKEVGRIVAYYYWWKANALGDMHRYEGFDALVRFIKFAPEYISFDECKYIESDPEIVTYTPFSNLVFSEPLLEEFTYPEKVVIQTKNGRAYTVKFYFKTSMERKLSQLREFQTHLKDEADKILQNSDNIQFDFDNLSSGEIVATYAVPSGKLNALKKTVDKIPEIVGTKDSPFYVYPSALITLLQKGSVPKEWDISSIKNDAIAKLNKTETEIKEGAKNPYWEKMKSSKENTYEGVIGLPVKCIENNKYFLEKVPDKATIEVEQDSEVAQSPDEKAQNPISNNTQKQAERVILWIAVISAAGLFLLHLKRR